MKHLLCICAYWHERLAARFASLRNCFNEAVDPRDLSVSKEQFFCPLNQLHGS